MKSNYDGTCKGPEKHSWKAGDEVFYDKTTKAICIDSKCFSQLKSGNPPKGSPQPKTRTESEKTEDNRHMLEINWQMAKAEAEKTIPIGTSETFSENKDRLILAEVFFKGLVDNWVKD